MLFNSIEYIFLFLPLVTLLYFMAPHRYRWLILLVTSYYFYMYWKWQYGILMMASTIITYFTAILIQASANEKQKKLFFYFGLMVDLLILFYFKYFNFIGESINSILSYFTISGQVPTLEVILPIGISFYTFQSLSYTIDVYRGKYPAEKHIGYYALYIAFFPQLVAGPIEKCNNLLPQFKINTQFNIQNIIIGTKLIVYGLFKKVVIADNLAIYVNTVYSDLKGHTGLEIKLAMLFFVFQVYCDFSAYSLIARGSAKYFDIELMQNFRYPFKASSYTELWSRWHISLTSWFREYVYIPLGGNQVSRVRWYVNVYIVYFLMGLWHGANWTYVFFGIFHGTVQVLEISLFKYIKFPKMLERIKFIWIILLFTLCCSVFLCKDMGEFYYIIANLFQLGSVEYWEVLPCLFLIFLIMILEWNIENNQDDFFSQIQKDSLRIQAFVLMIFSIIIFGVKDVDQFIYYQF